MSAKKLLAWYARNGRDLPWRKTRDPYHILVSEMMLQQTQVSRVIPFYQRWLKRFPTWEKLANAPPSTVLTFWSGLGYNRRALALQKIAQQIEKEGVPKTEADWLTLKGIGPYSAAAVSLFSAHEKTFPIDSIIRRVAGRFFLGKPFPKPSDDERIRSNASYFTFPSSRYWDVPQAYFDLGTLVCKKVPDCAHCPLQKECKSAPRFLSGTVRVPKRSIKKSHETVHDGKKVPDRIFRGRILRLLVRERRGIALQTLGKKIDQHFVEEKDGAWLVRILTRLERDQMITIRGQRAFLR